tara:strand:+ start:602 stop:922 length:321 start_codon:yes stop_codon:yes gene_type:complete
MVLYQFEDAETGEGVEVDFPMQEVPAIGAVVCYEGRRLRRLVSQTSQPKVMQNRFINYQVRTGTEEASGAEAYDSKGRPMFSSRHRAAEWARQKTGDGVIPITLED